MSTKTEKIPKPLPKPLSLRRSLGKLPRVSKEMIYESVRNQPLPLSPLVTPLSANTVSSSTSSPSPVTSTRSPSRRTHRVRRSSSFHTGDLQAMTSVAGPTSASAVFTKDKEKPDSPSWRNLFSFSRRGSRTDISPEQSQPQPAVPPVPAVISKKARARARSTVDITSGDFFHEPKVAGDDFKRRGSFLNNLSLSLRKPGTWGSRRARSKSNATMSTEEGRSPQTPNLSLQEPNGHEYSPVIDFNSPFASLLGEHRAPHLSFHHFEPLNVDFERAFNVASNVLEEGLPPHAQSTPSPEKDVSIASNSPRSSPIHSSYFIPCLGFKFPIPPTCTDQEVADLLKRGILIEDSAGESVWLPGIRPSSTALRAHLAVEMESNFEGGSSDIQATPERIVQMLQVADDETHSPANPAARFDAIAQRGRKKRHSIHGAFDTTSTNTPPRPSVSGPSQRHSIQPGLYNGALSGFFIQNDPLLDSRRPISSSGSQVQTRRRAVSTYSPVLERPTYI